MKLIKQHKSYLRTFLRGRIEWAEFETGLHVPFGGYVTKGEFLQILENLIEAYPDVVRYKEEHEWYKNQSAPLDQKIYKIEADTFWGSPRRPMYFQQYIGTDEEWISPERIAMMRSALDRVDARIVYKTMTDILNNPEESAVLRTMAQKWINENKDWIAQHNLDVEVTVPQEVEEIGRAHV